MNTTRPTRGPGSGAAGDRASNARALRTGLVLITTLLLASFGVSAQSLRLQETSVEGSSRQRSLDSARHAKASSLSSSGLQSQSSLLSSAPSAVCSIETIACGETIRARLDTADCDLGDGTFVDIYEFDGQAGQTIEVTMNAVDEFLDPYLLLEDPFFEFVAEDDDGNGGLDARIVATTDVDGLWAIYANHFEPVFGDPGRYDLRLECRGPPARPGGLVTTPLDSTTIGLDWNDNSNNEDEFLLELAESGGPWESLGSVPADTNAVDVVDLFPGTSYEFRVRAANAAGVSSWSNVAVGQTPGDLIPGPCLPGANTLCLNGGRFEVTIDWHAADGSSGFGNVAPAGTTDSGVFTFFDPTNWEFLVKVVDACTINSSYWVFAAGTTDLGYTLTVRDSVTGQVRRYSNSVGQASPAVTDTSAFATCP